MWQMVNIGPENIYFGELATQPVSVSSSVTPELGSHRIRQHNPCRHAPRRNSFSYYNPSKYGSVIWNENNVRLHAPNATWGSNRNYSLDPGETIAPGAQKTFTLIITAPSSEGTFDCIWQMQRIWNWGNGNVYGNFGDEIIETVNVNNLVIPFLNATVISHTVPFAMDASQVSSVTVTVENIGSETWFGNDNNIRLRTQSFQ